MIKFKKETPMKFLMNKTASIALATFFCGFNSFLYSMEKQIIPEQNTQTGKSSTARQLTAKPRHQKWVNIFHYFPKEIRRYIMQLLIDSIAVKDFYTEVGTLKNHSDSISSLLISADEKIIFFGGTGGFLCITDIDSQTALASHAFNKRVLAISAIPGCIAALTTQGSSAYLMDTSTGNQLAEFQHTYSINDVVTAAAFNSDGTKLLCGTSEGLLYVWDTQSYERIMLLEAGGSIHSVAFGCEDTTHPLGAPLLVGVNSKGLTIALSCDPSTICMWSEKTGKQRLIKKTRSAGPIQIVAGSSRDIFLSEQDELVSIQESNGAHCLNKLKETPAFKKKGEVYLDTTGSLSPGSLSFDGKRVVSYKGRTVHVWDINPFYSTVELITELVHTSPVCCVAFSPQRTYCIVGLTSGQVHIWKQTDVPPKKIKDKVRANFFACYKLLLSVSQDNNFDANINAILPETQALQANPAITTVVPSDEASTAGEESQPTQKAPWGGRDINSGDQQNCSIS